MQQVLAFVLTALAVAGSSTGTLMKPARHPAGHLFARHDRREAVELYHGFDPQREALGRRETVIYNANVKRSCTHDINDFAPRHLKDEHGQVLRKRQATTVSPNTGTAYPEPGALPPAANTLPKSWVDKYNEVKAQGLIPDIPVAVENAAGTVDYPAGTDLSKVCSWTTQKCNDSNIWQAPDNAVAFGIDDGPTPDGTQKFVNVLNKYNVSATHFLIGSAIYWNQDAMKVLIDASPKQHLAVHTWSHTLQSTKTDLEVLGDLGWVMQIIYDLSGVIPMYFRPPEGDVDNRVKAIAKYVLGMQTVMWTHDADDWCLREGNGTATSIDSCVQSAPNLKTVRRVQKAWATPKTNNTGWITLNHETTDQASVAFSSLVRAAKKEDWNVVGNIPDMQALPWYNNAYGPDDTAVKQDDILPTRDFINITNPTAAKGSDEAPKLGNWAKSAATQQSGAGAQLSGSNESGSASTSKSSSTSGAAAFGVASVLGTASFVCAALALV